MGHAVARCAGLSCRMLLIHVDADLAATVCTPSACVPWGMGAQLKHQTQLDWCKQVIMVCFLITENVS